MNDTKFMKLSIHIKYKCLKSGKILHQKISVYDIQWNESKDQYQCFIKCPECEKYHMIVLDD